MHVVEGAQKLRTLAPRDRVLQSSHLCAHSQKPRTSFEDQRVSYIYKAQPVVDTLGIVIPSNHNVRCSQFFRNLYQPIAIQQSTPVRKSVAVELLLIFARHQEENQTFTTFNLTETLRTMMFKNSNASVLMLLLVVGVTFAAESYLDYGDEAEDRNLENLREFYRMLLRRNSVDNVRRNAADNLALAGIPLEHLMIRKSQRSPSLRLRFGRSGPVMSAGILTRPNSQQEAFDDN